MHGVVILTGPNLNKAFNSKFWVATCAGASLPIDECCHSGVVRADVADGLIFGVLPDGVWGMALSPRAYELLESTIAAGSNRDKSTR